MPSENRLSYQSYLQLDKLLSAQERQSELVGKPAHHEWFFIVVHQTSELWFKQMLIELEWVIQNLKIADHDSSILLTINAALERICSMQNLLNQHIVVLETLSPDEFLSFRDFLTPASGFQSFQFRQIEALLGLYHDKPLAKNDFYVALSEEQQQQLQTIVSNGSTLFDAVEDWLARFSHSAIVELEQHYQEVEVKLTKRKQYLASRSEVHTTTQDIQFEQLKNLLKTFEEAFNPKKYQSAGHRLCHNSFLSALFLYVNQKTPEFQPAYQVIKQLIKFDELLTTWRHSHALMVQRMIGTKVGTGGTSGYDYLLETAMKKRVFNELTNLAGYLISDLYLDY